MGFYNYETFPVPSGSTGKSVIIFRVDMSSLAHVDNKKIYFDSW